MYGGLKQLCTKEEEDEAGLGSNVNDITIDSTDGTCKATCRAR